MTTKLSNSTFSLDIPADDLAAIQAALQVLQDKLLPRLVDLDAEDRRALLKMGARSVDFVGKTLGHTRANVQMKPGFVDLDAFDRDWTALDTLREMLNSLNHLRDMTDDTLFLVGSKAYAAALACYKAFQAAAKMNQPGAALIVEDLAGRFNGQGRIAKPTPPTPPASSPFVQ